jgi:hypothetical protein
MQTLTRIPCSAGLARQARPSIMERSSVLEMIDVLSSLGCRTAEWHTTEASKYAALPSLRSL